MTGPKWLQAGPDVIPAWVADMDFPVAQPIRDAVMHRVTTDLGYPDWPWEQPGLPCPRPSPTGWPPATVSTPTPPT